MSGYETIPEIRDAHEAAGGHFFDADAKHFFRSRILRDVIGGCYFVTSERFVGADGAAETRRYTVRRILDNALIETVGRFQAYPTAEAARAAATAAYYAEIREAMAAVLRKADARAAEGAKG